MGDMDLEITSEFLIMAATLLEIKSKMLLPIPKNEYEPEQLEMEQIDPRSELVRSLVEYRKYKYASSKLRDFEEIQSKVYYKPKEDLSSFDNDDSDIIEMDLDKLVLVFKNLMLKGKIKEKTLELNEIERDDYTLEECIKKIKNKLKKNKVIRFYDLFNCNTTRNEIISIFLSLLELVKSKYIVIYQKRNFDEIFIRRLKEEGDGING